MTTSDSVFVQLQVNLMCVSFVPCSLNCGAMGIFARENGALFHESIAREKLVLRPRSSERFTGNF